MSPGPVTNRAPLGWNVQTAPPASEVMAKRPTTGWSWGGSVASSMARTTVVSSTDATMAEKTDRLTITRDILRTP